MLNMIRGGGPHIGDWVGGGDGVGGEDGVGGGDGVRGGDWVGGGDGTTREGASKHSFILCWYVGILMRLSVRTLIPL